MNNRSLEVFFAILLGALLGAELGRHVYNQWWVCGLIGGLVGYLAYDFRSVVAETPGAWQKAKQAAGWRPKHKITWGDAYYHLLWSCAVTCGTIPLAALTSLPVQKGKMAYFIFTAITFSLELSLLGYSSWRRDKTVAGAKKIALKWNFFTVWFYRIPKFLLVRLFLGLSFVVTHIPMAFLACCHFVRILFVTIYGKERLLCLTWAAIAAATGNITGHIPVMALGGAVLGVVQYELISKRWLRLVPQ